MSRYDVIVIGGGQIRVRSTGASPMPETARGARLAA